MAFHEALIDAAGDFDVARGLLSIQDWRRLRRWYRLHGRHYLPWRQGAQPWGILLAETLLRRTRAEIAARVYRQTLTVFRCPADVLAKPERWRLLTRPLGLAWRAETFLDACEILVRKHGGHVPATEANLLELPGVGHYVAGAVRCFGFAERTVLTDTNTIRLAARISGKTLDPARHRTTDVQLTVARLGPAGKPATASDNFALFDLAATVCRPVRPRCDVCPIATGCSTGKAWLCGRNNVGARLRSSKPGG